MAIQSGLSSSGASSLISVIGISNSVGPVMSGWLATKTNLIPASLFCSLLPSCEHYWSLLVMISVFRFSISAWPTHSSAGRSPWHNSSQHCFWWKYTKIICLIIKLFRNSDICSWVAALVGPSSAGFILDSFSADFFLPFYIGSALFGVSAFLLCIIWCVDFGQHSFVNYL